MSSSVVCYSDEKYGLSKHSTTTHLGGEAAEERVPDVAQSEREILVEEILKELAHAEVRPSAVDEQQSFEVGEPSKSKVTREDRLLALLATDTHANVSGYTQTDRYSTRQ